MVVSTFIVKSTLGIVCVVFAYFLMSFYAFFFSGFTCLLTNCILMHFPAVFSKLAKAHLVKLADRAMIIFYFIFF